MHLNIYPAAATLGMFPRGYLCQFSVEIVSAGVKAHTERPW